MFKLLVLFAALCSFASTQKINFGFTTGTRSLWVSTYMAWVGLGFSIACIRIGAMDRDAGVQLQRQRSYCGRTHERDSLEHNGQRLT